VAIWSETMGDSERHFDGREMTMLHDMFRGEFGLLPALVRETPDGDVPRAQVVADHAELIAELLHHHHEVEDEFVWPLLRKRAPQQAVVPMEMEDQHAEIAAIGTRVNEARNRWRSSASATDRTEMADGLDRLIPVLRNHLSQEEEQVVPLIEAHVTAAEWAEIQGKAAAGLDPELMPLTFGMVFYEAEPEAIQSVLGNMPAEQREALWTQSTQAFAEYSQRVHGTPTPHRG
jgi:hemerythrin-like domain-containing protein